MMAFYEGCVIFLLMLICILLLKILATMQEAIRMMQFTANSARVTDWLDSMILFVEETRDFCQDIQICGNYHKFLGNPSHSEPFINISEESKDILDYIHIFK